jgi:hypothetical protein
MLDAKHTLESQQMQETRHEFKPALQSQTDKIEEAKAPAEEPSLRHQLRHVNKMPLGIFSLCNIKAADLLANALKNQQ